MIAKITTGSYAKGMVLYNHNKTIKIPNKLPSGLLLATQNISNTNVDSIINSIIRQNNLNTNVEKPNIHFSLNFHKNDVLSNKIIMNIGKDYMDKMGYGDQPYAVYRHFDTDHPHIHIVTSQIDHNGKLIDTSHNFRKSNRTSRSLELKYNITKALDHRTIHNIENLNTKLHLYLNEGQGPLLPLLRNIIDTVLESKPSSLSSFDALLKKYNVIREEKTGSTKGHVFKIIPIDQIENEKYFSKHKGIPGIEIDHNFSYSAILNEVSRNFKGRDQTIKSTQGKVFSIYNKIDQPILLSDFINQNQKKGIILSVKRRQTGAESGKINGFIFKDIQTGFSYTATDLKIKSIELSNKLIDDLRDKQVIGSAIDIAIDVATDVLVENLTNELEEDLNVEDPVESIDNALDAIIQLFESNYSYPEEEVLLKKRKKKRKNNK